MLNLNKRYVVTTILSAITLVALGGCTTTSAPSGKGEQAQVQRTPASRLDAASLNGPVRVGAFEIFDPKVLSILDLEATIDVLARGFEWVEGPVWSAEDEALLFSDIPTHKVYRYKAGQGVSELLTHSGFSNGLVFNNQQQLILMQSRTRQIGLLKNSISTLLADGNKRARPVASAPDGHTEKKVSTGDATFDASKYLVLASHFQGKKFNSPNDGVFSRKGGTKGTLYFTDPPYGLAKQLEDPAKELAFQGVYALSPKGNLTLLDDSLVYPNGIALSPDEKTLYVSASNTANPSWYNYVIDDDGRVHSRKLFHQAPVQSHSQHGLPDGLKVHRSGIVFATGPEGIWVFDPQGVLLAKVHLPSIAANLAFNADQTKVFVTAHHQLLSFSLKP
ncbi:Gluconolactonase [Paraglaciecola mesophila]|uniref:Gluconolactonase n=1 Tax=Paraglaciecola mesophila TaxID=197222 RepID=A0A857JSL0_9ALTE|nr:SMP-30/gluconolactonase/LRE family protein [Paraglaciecola mesophila]QHJ13947.1 Gluconolactonase [Paraglaciecola mesophila]